MELALALDVGAEVELELDTGLGVPRALENGAAGVGVVELVSGAAAEGVGVVEPVEAGLRADCESSIQFGKSSGFEFMASVLGVVGAGGVESVVRGSAVRAVAGVASAEFEAGSVEPAFGGLAGPGARGPELVALPESAVGAMVLASGPGTGLDGAIAEPRAASGAVERLGSGARPSWAPAEAELVAPEAEPVEPEVELVVPGAELVATGAVRVEPGSGAASSSAAAGASDRASRSRASRRADSSSCTGSVGSSSTAGGVLCVAARVVGIGAGGAGGGADATCGAGSSRCAAADAGSSTLESAVLTARVRRGVRSTASCTWTCTLPNDSRATSHQAAV